MQKKDTGSTWLLIILLVVGIGGYWLYSTHTKMPNLGTISPQSYSVTTDKQPLTSAQINTILCDNHSPACGTGSTLYTDAVNTHISDSYALAVFKAESSYGTAGVARTTRSLGNILCSSGYVCYDGFRSYSTWEAGYADWFSLINNLYVGYFKLTTVDKIAYKYAPTSDNDTVSYINNIESTMSDLSK